MTVPRALNQQRAAHAELLGRLSIIVVVRERRVSTISVPRLLVFFPTVTVCSPFGVPCGELLRVPCGELLRVPCGVLLRMPFGVPFGMPFTVPFGVLLRVPFGVLLQVPFGVPFTVPFGVPFGVPFRAADAVLRPAKATADWLPK